ncbi:LysR family transcriptional regulator, partial [Pseudomonas aeruginosa]
MNTDNHGEENSPFRRRRLPSLNALRCFEAAARLENFSRAAEALCLTHGAISRAVRTLEEELGCALFERRGQRVFLSEAGRRLLAGTGPALDLIERTGETLRAEAGPTALVLSCEPTLLMRWLIPRIAGFMQEQPRLSIQLVAGGGPFAFGRGIDLAIRRNDFPWPPGSHAHWLFDEQVGPVCRASDVERHFHLDAGPPGLRAVAPRLHTAT